jgi:hypothetical protein
MKKSPLLLFHLTNPLIIFHKNFSKPNLICLLFFLILSVTVNAQNLPSPSSCTSKDLELVSATLPPNPGQSQCSCDGKRRLWLAIKNKTGSTRTSFAYWATLIRIDAEGDTISTEPINGCNGPIAKNTSPNPFTITTLPFDSITISCNETLVLSNLFLAWTSSNNNEVCPLNPSTINPKCGTLPSIQIVAGVDASFTVTSATCSNGTNSIVTTPFGGTPPYTYAWTTQNGTIPAGQEDDKDLSGLTPGTYNLRITDFAGCFKDRSRVITNPSALALGTCSKTDVTCYGGSNGSVTAGAVTNNVGTINYSWKNAANVVVGSQASVNNLPAGNYTLTVTDDCGTVTCNVTIGGPAAAVSSTFTQVNNACYGGSIGSINLSPAGGTGPYTFAWTASNGGSIPAGQSDDEDLSALVKGTYSVVITDANGTTGGCRSERSITITEPASPLAIGTCSKTDVSCNGGSNGSVTAGTVSNSVGTVNYTWKNAANATVGITATVPNLPAGNYSLTVTDDCSSVNCNVTIGQPSAALSATETHVNNNCFGGSSGSINLSPSGGTSPYTFAWTASAGGAIPPGQSANEDLTGLVKGTYDVVITDANGTTGGCRTTKSVVITQPAAALALGTCTKTDATCTTGGSVTAGAVTNSVGTVEYTWRNAQNTVVGTTSSVSDLPAGTYTLTVEDDCSFQTCSVTISAPGAIDPPTVELTQPTLCGTMGSATITSPAPGPDVEFSIDDGANWQSSNVFPNLGIGSVTGVRVKIGDCISNAATLPGNDCAPQERMASSPASVRPAVITGKADNSIAAPAKAQTEILNGTTVNAFPNPFNDRVKFVVTVPNSGYGTLELMNIQGQKIKTIYSGQIVKGGQVFEMEVPALRNNTMIYVFRMGGKQITGKLVQLNQ